MQPPRGCQGRRSELDLRRARLLDGDDAGCRRARARCGPCRRRSRRRARRCRGGRARRASPPRCGGRCRGSEPPKENMRAPPTRTASRRGAPRRSAPLGDEGGHGAVGELAAGASRSPFEYGSMMCASPATGRAASTSTSPMHEPSPIDASTWSGVRDAKSSPMRTIPPALRSPGESQPGEELPTPSRLGMSMNESEHSSPSTTGRSRGGARRRSPRRPSRAPSRRWRRACRWSTAAAAARARARSSPERADVGGAEDVADLGERREADLGVRARRRAGRRASAASAGGKRSRTSASMSPEIGRTTAVTGASGGPAASTASASGSASAAGTETSIDRPSIVERAVAAVPEPMLASSRRASSCWSE